MENSQFFKAYEDFRTFCPDHYGKTTLFENEHMLVGLNCLEAGQCMDKHAHAHQDRFYVVLEGKGRAWVGDQSAETSQGAVIWVPSNHTHRLENTGSERWVLLVGITPSHEG